MTATQHRTLTDSGLRRVLVGLCATEITSWGVLSPVATALAPWAVRAGAALGPHARIMAPGSTTGRSADAANGV